MVPDQAIELAMIQFALQQIKLTSRIASGTIQSTFI
jgi:hypothetical protein